MKCPKCGNETNVVKNDVSNNAEKGDKHKEYNRTVYHCEADDVWINIETPKE